MHLTKAMEMSTPAKGFADGPMRRRKRDGPVRMSLKLDAYLGVCKGYGEMKQAYAVAYHCNYA